MIVSPFVQGRNYTFSDEEGLFYSYSNATITEKPIKGELEAKQGYKFKIKLDGNRVEVRGLKLDDLETVQRIYDFVREKMEVPKKGKYRGFIVLKKNGIYFDIDNKGKKFKSEKVKESIEEKLDEEVEVLSPEDISDLEADD